MSEAEAKLSDYIDQMKPEDREFIMSVSPDQWAWSIVNGHDSLDQSFGAIARIDDMIRGEIKKSKMLEFYLACRVIFMQSIESRINQQLGDRGAAFQFTQSGVNIAAHPQWLLQEIAGEQE